MSELISKCQPRGRRSIVEVAYLKCDRACGFDVKQDWHLATETDVLRPGTDVESDGGLPFSGFGAIDHRDGVFDGQSTQRWGHWLRPDHFEFQKPIALSIFGSVAGEFRLSLPPENHIRGSRINGPGLGTHDVQLPRNRALVEHLDQMA